MRCIGFDHRTPLISATPLPGTIGNRAASPLARPAVGPVVGTKANTTASVRWASGAISSVRTSSTSRGRTAGR